MCHSAGAMLVLAGASCAAQAQQVPGTNDPTFNTADVILNANGFDGAVYSMAQQSDGKLLVGGGFNSYADTTRHRIARLNTDRSLDDSFNPGAGFNGLVLALALQSDGKIIVGGNYTSYNGTSRNYIARLNADGSVDESFTSGAEFNGPVRAIALQPDGKVVVGGNFTMYNGTSRNNIARLNTDGSLDNSFNPGTGFTGFSDRAVLSIFLLDNGKMVVGGRFSSYNDNALNNIARINADGTLDTSFNTGTGFNGRVNDIVVQGDDKIVVVGMYTFFNGEPNNMIARLNTDGSLDASFSSGIGFNGAVYTVNLQSDGKMLVGGTFNNYNRTFRSGISLLNTDGSLDASFNSGAGFYVSVVNAIVLQQDGMVAVGGNFNYYNGSPRNRFATLHTDGALEDTSAPITGFDNTVSAIALHDDGKIVVGGSFLNFNDTSRNYIARLHADGSLDTSFDSDISLGTAVHAIALQPDSKLVIGGEFEHVGNISRRGIARLNANGALDYSFITGFGFDGSVQTVAIQADGKVLAGGNFMHYNGTAASRIVRLQADGSLDQSFSTGTGFNGQVFKIVVQQDGKVVIGGMFSSYNGTACNYIVRLKTDGSLDKTFDSGTGFNGSVHTMVLQPNGNLVVGGSFSSYNGVSRTRIARLKADGSLDDSFNPEAGLNNTVYAIALQKNGKLVVGGNFSTYNHSTQKGLARLNSDGSLDASFGPVHGFDNSVRAVALQYEDKVVAGGEFVSFDNIPRTRIARPFSGEGNSLSAGTDQRQGLDVLVYPNPTYGDVHVQFLGAEVTGAVKLALFDTIGRQVLSREVTAAEVSAGVKLSTSGVAGGVYILRISNRGRHVSQKLVLQE